MITSPSSSYAPFFTLPEEFLIEIPSPVLSLRPPYRFCDTKIVQAAQQQGQNILKTARKNLAAASERGYEEGLQQIAEEAAENNLSLLDDVVSHFSHVESKAVKMLLNILEKVFFSLPVKTRMIHLIRNGIGVMKEQKKITIRLCPLEVALIEECLSDILSGFHSIRFADAKADARLQKGDCIIESEIGLVDAGFNTQLTTLSNALISKLGDTA